MYLSGGFRMDDKRVELLEKAPTSTAILKMAGPSIAGLLVMAIYNIVDTMFVAWIGTEATGATQIVFPLVMIIGALGLTFGIGGSAIISRLLGEKNYKKAEQILATNVALAVLTGVIISIVCILNIDFVLKILGARDKVLPLSKDYGVYILIGASAQMLNMTLNNLLRGEGSAKYSMISMITGAVVNIVLDPLFIFGMGMGIKGAAIATTISQCVTSIMLLSQYFRGKTVLKLRSKNVVFDRVLINEVIKMGSPSFMQQILMSLSITLLNQFSGIYGGEAAIAAVGIVSRVMLIISYVIFGLAQGFQPVAGYNYGMKKQDRLKQSYRFTVRLSFGIAVVAGLGLLFFNESILGIFKPSASVLALAKTYMKMSLLSILMMSVTTVIATYYQAIGENRPSLAISVARQGLCFIPLITILPTFLGIRGVFIAQPLADGVTLVGALVYRHKHDEKPMIMKSTEQ